MNKKALIGGPKSEAKNNLFILSLNWKKMCFLLKKTALANN